MSQKNNLYNLCTSHGFFLREHFLEARLLVVLLNPTIVIKADLQRERKENLLSNAISHLLCCPQCRLAIYWEGEEHFFHL